jgi:hypothetical protein
MAKIIHFYKHINKNIKNYPGRVSLPGHRAEPAAFRHPVPMLFTHPDPMPCQG